MLSAPASVQTIPTNANNQDVVSMGCISARMTRQLTGKVWKLAAIQALALAQAADLRGGDLMGGDYANCTNWFAASRNNFPWTVRWSKTLSVSANCWNPMARNRNCFRPGHRHREKL